MKRTRRERLAAADRQAIPLRVPRPIHSGSNIFSPHTSLSVIFLSVFSHRPDGFRASVFPLPDAESREYPVEEYRQRHQSGPRIKCGVTCRDSLTWIRSSSHSAPRRGIQKYPGEEYHQQHQSGPRIECGVTRNVHSSWVARRTNREAPPLLSGRGDRRLRHRRGCGTRCTQTVLVLYPSLACPLPAR